MAEIVNLRMARKRKARDDKNVAASENRARFGRTKSDRDKAEAEVALASRLIDNHKLTEKE